MDTKELIIENNSQELRLRPRSYSKILAFSFEKCEQDIFDLEKAIDEGDYDSIKTIAHKLKGVYSNLRITDIYEPCANIDKTAMANGCIDTIRRFFSEVRESFFNMKQLFT